MHTFQDQAFFCLSFSQELPIQQIHTRHLYNKELIATSVVRLLCAFMTECPNALRNFGLSCKHLENPSC